MYCDFFGFSEKPFNITPNPRFIFLSKNHKEVFAHLLYGIRSHCGFIEITGEVGTGKTTALRTLLNQLDSESYRLAFIFNPSLSALELLRGINAEFGIGATALSAAGLLENLNGFLLRENAAGRTVVLVIDEAQNLQPAVLEQIRMLSNLETETDKLIQIILVGQPELGTILSRPELRQLSQRITVRYHLRPMDFDDTRDYILHRLEVAGIKSSASFAPRAIRKIYSYTGGFPRMINILCDRALLVGYTEESRTISKAMVETAICELRRQGKPGGYRLWPALAALAASLVGLGGALSWSEYDLPGESTAALPGTAVQPINRKPLETASKAAESPGQEMLQQSLAALGQAASATAAVNALTARWGEPSLAAGERLSAPAELKEAFGRRGISATPYHGDFNYLLRLNSPALLELNLPGIADSRYLALTSIRADKVTVSPSLNGRVELLLSELQGLWTGNAYVTWKNYLNIPSMDQPEQSGRGVLQLQSLLLDAGEHETPSTGEFDAGTISVVTRFQTARGIVRDGRVGPQTLILLYQAARKHHPPTLTLETPGEES